MDLRAVVWNDNSARLRPEKDDRTGLKRVAPTAVESQHLPVVNTSGLQGFRNLPDGVGKYGGCNCVVEVPVFSHLNGIGKNIGNGGVLNTAPDKRRLPGPHIGKKHEKLLRSIKEQGFDVGIHAYDHQKWQDGVTNMSSEEITSEFQKALNEFERIFGVPATTAAAPGWQANAKTLEAYDKANLIYASDCRGFTPFFPKANDKTYKTLQIPTTLPTLDELLGRPEFPLENLADYYLSLLRTDRLNVLNIHPELEGMKYFDWFRSLLIAFKEHKVEFKNLSEVVGFNKFPTCELIQQKIEGRSGKRSSYFKRRHQALDCPRGCRVQGSPEKAWVAQVRQLHRKVAVRL